MSPRLKNVLVIGAGLALAAVGVSNLVLKASFTLMDDGAFWRQTAQGLVAARIAPGCPAARAGVREGDVLVAVDAEEALSPGRLESLLATRRSGERATYTLLRESERRVLDVVVQPLARGNVSAFYYLSLAGFFCLVVGSVVLLRRPPDRPALHFYAVCALFFLVYSISYTGSLTRFDWVLFWVDSLAVLFLPAVFLHFCLAFPERRPRAARAWREQRTRRPRPASTSSSRKGCRSSSRSPGPTGRSSWPCVTCSTRRLRVASWTSSRFRTRRRGSSEASRFGSREGTVRTDRSSRRRLVRASLFFPGGPIQGSGF